MYLKVISGNKIFSLLLLKILFNKNILDILNFNIPNLLTKNS